MKFPIQALKSREMSLSSDSDLKFPIQDFKFSIQDFKFKRVVPDSGFKISDLSLQFPI